MAVVGQFFILFVKCYSIRSGQLPRGAINDVHYCNGRYWLRYSSLSLLEHGQDRIVFSH
jgi:hypothetical protein